MNSFTEKTSKGDHSATEPKRLRVSQAKIETGFVFDWPWARRLPIIEVDDKTVPEVGVKDLEERVLALVASKGWQVERQPNVRDHGADLVVRDPIRNRRLVVECKAVTGTVGSETIRQTLALQRSMKVDGAIVASTGGFSAQAKDTASRHRVVLWLIPANAAPDVVATPGDAP